MLLTPSIGNWDLCDKCLIATFEGSLKKSVLCSWILAWLQINPLASLWTKRFNLVSEKHEKSRSITKKLHCSHGWNASLHFKKKKTENLSHINFLRSSYKWEKNNKAQCDSWLTEQKDWTFLCFFVIFFFFFLIRAFSDGGSAYQPPSFKMTEQFDVLSETISVSIIRHELDSISPPAVQCFLDYYNSSRGFTPRRQDLSASGDTGSEFILLLK